MKTILSLLVLLLGLASSFAFCDPKALSPEDKAIWNDLSTRLSANPGDYFERTIHRLGDKKIEWEAFVSQETTYATAEKIFADLKQYPKWALPHINEKPGGGTYYLKLMNLIAPPDRKDVLDAFLQFDLPIFHCRIERKFLLHFTPTPNVFTINMDAIPSDDAYIKSVKAVAKIFPMPNNSNRVWAFAKANIELKNWLLYEALPEKLLNHESGERLQTFIDNYLAEEDKLKSSQSPTEKTAARDATSQPIRTRAQ